MAADERLIDVHEIAAGNGAVMVRPPAGWLIDAADLLAMPDPGPTPWLVDGLIVEAALVAVVGRWKTTKSYGLLDICVAIATGRPVFGGLTVPSPGPVVFVNEESGRIALHRRLGALCRGRAIDPDELRGQLHVAPNARVKLDDIGWQIELVELGKELQPRLFVFDPLVRMKSAGRDESAQKEMAPIVEYLRALRDETGAAVAFVHHTGHQGATMRGTSDLESAWETRLAFVRDGQAPLVTIEPEHREAEAGDPIRYRLNWDHDSRSMRFELADDTGDAIRSLEARFVDLVEQTPGLRLEEIAATLEIRVADVRRVATDAVAAGTVTVGRSGRTDKLGRPVRDNVYTLAAPGSGHQTTLDTTIAASQPDPGDGSSQTPETITPGTSHGTSHDGPSQTPDDPDDPPAETAQPRGIVARPDTGTTQDKPDSGHRGSLARPAPLGAGAGTSHPDEPPREPTTTPPEPDWPAEIDDTARRAAASSSSAGGRGQDAARETNDPLPEPDL